MKHLKEKGKYLQPTIQIGKNKITESIIKEIKLQLKKKKNVKIKLLQSFLEGKDKKYRKEIAQKLAKETNSQLIDQVGFVIVLHKD